MKRSQILNVASRALAAGGIADLDLAKIAQEVGIKPSSLRYYFKNREDLAEAIYHDRLSEIEDQIEAANKSDTLGEMVSAFFGSLLQTYAAPLRGVGEPRAQIGEVRTLEKTRRARVGAHFLELLERIREILEERGVTSDLCDGLLPAQMLLETYFWIPAWVDHFREWEFVSVQEDLASLFLNGLVSRGADSHLLDVAPLRPKASSAQSQNDGFLKAATVLINQRGYRGMSIDAISAAMGVTKGSFYHHNAEKKHLVEQCFYASHDRISALQAAATSREEDPLKAIVAVIASIVDAQCYQTEPLIRYSALPGLPNAIRRSTIAGADPLDRWFVGQIASARSSRPEMTSVDPYIAAQFISTIANASYDSVWLYKEEAGSELTAGLLDRIFRGFAS